MRTRLSLLLLLLALSVGAFGADPKLEKVTRPAQSPVPDTIWQVVDAEGFRVDLDDGPLCEIWLRKSVPVSSAKGNEEALFAVRALDDAGRYQLPEGLNGLQRRPDQTRFLYATL